MKKKKPLTYVLTGTLTVGILGAIPAFAAEEDTGTTNDSTVADKQTDPEFGRSDRGHGGKFRLDEDQLKEKAEDLGIESTDKDSRELAKEIMNAEFDKRAKELGIDTEGKDHRTVMEEIRGAELSEKAKELGISTEGKEQADLAREVREALLKKEAKELGISIDGKELKEIAIDVREAALVKQAKDLGIETQGKDEHELRKEVFEASVLKAAKELGISADGKSTRELMDEIMTDYVDEAEKLDFFPFNKKEESFFRMGGKGHHGPGHGMGLHDDGSAPSEAQVKEPAADSTSETF